jgi:hypothetical protein
LWGKVGMGGVAVRGSRLRSFERARRSARHPPSSSG